MTRHALWFVVLTLAAGVLVAAAGAALAPAAGGAVAVGAAVACGFQLLLFAVAAVAFPGKAFLAYGLGLLGRLVLVAVAALVVVPASGLAAAPLLFALVAVLFATTLLEPLLLASAARKNA